MIFLPEHSLRPKVRNFQYDYSWGLGEHTIVRVTCKCCSEEACWDKTRPTPSSLPRGWRCRFGARAEARKRYANSQTRRGSRSLDTHRRRARAGWFDDMSPLDPIPTWHDERVD